MIITIAGDLGSGKSTVSKMLAKDLGYKHYSSGDFMRSLAKEKGIAFHELTEIAKTDEGKIDKEIDERQKKLGEEEDNFVIDGRLAWHFIPHSLKIYIGVDEAEGAKRIYEAKRESEPETTSIQKTIELNKERLESESIRYRKYYGIDRDDMSNYDLLIDSTDLSAEQVKEKIKEFLKNCSD